MPGKHIMLITGVTENIVLPSGRKRKCIDLQISKFLVLLQAFTISYRSVKIFFTNHEEYLISRENQT